MSAGGNFYAFSAEQRANAHRRDGGESSKRAHQPTGGHVIVTAPETPTDGQLKPARRALSDAVASLVDPKPETLDGQLVWTDSLYQQLTDSVPGSKRERSGVARSQPPIWLDAAQLLKDINAQIARWEPRWPVVITDGQLLDEHPAILRLRCINARKWRPQDVQLIEAITTQLVAWAADIKLLFDPPARWHIAAACPACNTRTVYRKDSAGEHVRQPALQVTKDGCECMACRHSWGPSYLEHLRAVIDTQ